MAPGVAPAAGTYAPSTGKGKQGPSRRAKAAALMALTLQNAVYALLIKYSNTSAHARGGAEYLGSAVVVVTELAKAVLAIGLLQLETSRALPILIASDWRSSWLFGVPAVVYTVQVCAATATRRAQRSRARSPPRRGAPAAEQPHLRCHAVPRCSHLYGARAAAEAARASPYRP